MLACVEVEITGARTSGEPSGAHGDRRAPARDSAGGLGAVYKYWAWIKRRVRLAIALATGRASHMAGEGVTLSDVCPPGNSAKSRLVWMVSG